MLDGLRHRARDEAGFTLIELLVVVVVIGLLAAIALPTFLGQKDKATDASAKSNARNAVSQIDSCLVDATPAFCATDAQVLGARGAGSLSITGSDTYTVTAQSGTGNTFTIRRVGSTGAYVRTCTNSGTAKGGCPADLSW